MWGIIIAFGLVGGLMELAFLESTEPVIKPAWQKIRLARLARIPANRLTLDQAEDGMVLSRRMEEKDLEKRFAKVATELRRHRARITRM